MRKIILLAVALISLTIQAQESQFSRIFINVLQPERSEIPNEASKQLEVKLNQLLTVNGIADTDPANRFVLTTKALVQTKDIVAGPPQKVSMNIDFVFMIGDAIENKIFESVTVSSIGVGINENKAFIAAIKNVKPKNPELVDFLNRAKQTIADYYSFRCAQIQADAKQAAIKGNYDEAIYMLMQVPDVCDCATECQDLMIAYTRDCQNAKAARLLNEAKALWASSPNSEGAAKAADVIARIPAGSSSQNELDKLIREINGKLKSDEKKAWDFKMQQYNDRIEKEKREFALREEQQRSDNEYRAKQQVADNAYRERQQQANNEYRRQQQAADNEHRRQQQAADNEYRRTQQTADNAARKQYIEAARQVGIEYAKNQPKSVSYTKNVILW